MPSKKKTPVRLRKSSSNKLELLMTSGAATIKITSDRTIARVLGTTNDGGTPVDVTSYVARRGKIAHIDLIQYTAGSTKGQAVLVDLDTANSMKVPLLELLDELDIRLAEKDLPTGAAKSRASRKTRK